MRVCRRGGGGFHLSILMLKQLCFQTWLKLYHWRWGLANIREKEPLLPKELFPMAGTIFILFIYRSFLDNLITSGLGRSGKFFCTSSMM